jgi:ATP-dependent Clp protease ATP-binding subunit ClpA
MSCFSASGQDPPRLESTSQKRRPMTTTPRAASPIAQPGTPRAMRILERSRDEATAAGATNFIGVEHIFLAILHEGRTVPAQVVSELGYTTSILERLSEFLRSEGYRRRGTEE